MQGRKSEGGQQDQGKSQRKDKKFVDLYDIERGVLYRDRDGVLYRRSDLGQIEQHQGAGQWKTIRIYDHDNLRVREY